MKRKKKIQGIHASDKKYLWLFLAPTIIIFLVILVYPMLYTWRISLDNFSLTSPEKREFVGLKNFFDLIQNEQFIKALFRSILFTTLSTTFTFLLGFTIAYLLSNKYARGKSILQSIYIIPMVMTPYVIGQTWRFLLDFGYGPIQHIITSFGLPKINFLGKANLAFLTTVMVDVWQWTPFVILIMYAGLQTLPKEPLEAAKVDGASWTQKFLLIEVPLLKSSILAVLLLRIMEAFKEFDKIFSLTGGGPGSSSEVLSLYIYKNGFQYFNMGKAAAMSIFMLFFLVIISNTFIKKSGVIKFK